MLHELACVSRVYSCFATLNWGSVPHVFFLVSDLRKFKEAKKQFDKVSEEKEAALIKNAQAPRNKQHEVEEATNILTATRKCFRHIVLDYVLQVNQLWNTRPCVAKSVAFWKSFSGSTVDRWLAASGSETLTAKLSLAGFFHQVARPTWIWIWNLVLLIQIL